MQFLKLCYDDLRETTFFDSAQSNLLGLETNDFSNIFEFSGQCFSQQRALQKSPFPLRTLPANMTKSAGNCGFGHIY